MVKASAGGGGKGMRVVRSADQLPAAVEGARREAEAAFGDDTLFLERYVDGARHIEVQVFGDAQGHVRHLFERECSIQRRHQKVIEEAPSPFVDEALREQLGKTAVAAAEAVGYVGAGTVEFIVGADRLFYFLEMNTRLQVEHPVTELVTGLDLVRQQLLVAQGRDPELDGVDLYGAAIEARLYAEDPDADFLPQSGRLVEWVTPPGVRVDAGVAAGDDVSAYFDPLLAKVVGRGADRREAAARLVRGLRDLRVHGVRTNRDFLVQVLEHPSFLRGDTTIDFLERVNPSRRRTVGTQELQRAVVAAGLADRAAASAERTAPGGRPAQLPVGLPPGWGNPLGVTRYGYRFGAAVLTLTCRDLGNERFLATVDGTEVTGRVHGWYAPDLDLELDGVREAVAVTTDPDTGRVWIQGTAGEVALTEQPRFPVREPDVPSGSLVAPMNGSVVAVDVAVGDAVEPGATVLVLEAMKMEHRVVAPVAGVVRELRATVGEAVAADALLAVIETAEPSS